MTSGIEEITNPFSVQTPEDITAEDARSLFVNVFTDFQKIPHIGHSFLHGPRGSGKSMMFRYLQPDCQCLERNCQVRELPFYGIYVPVKNTSLDLSELVRLEKQHASTLLNEHFLTMYIAVKAFASVAKVPVDDADTDALKAAAGFFDETFLRLLRGSGFNGDVTVGPFSTPRAYLEAMERVCDQAFSAVITYLKRLSFQQAALPYDGPLCGYSDFLHPLFRDMRKLPFMPKAPIFLLIDDADNLNETQTRILNSWVSSRTSADISIKISTQLNYKTYRTTTGRTIDSPHDYSEINISDIYTSSKSRYRKRLTEIVQKRLALYEINVTPEQFFPPNKTQEEAIDAIGRQIRDDWKEKGRGHRPDDDSLRYARPMYIASLKGLRKSGSTYSYAGFDQLVHISSGIIRYFLEPAAAMFSEEVASAKGKHPKFINHSVQNEVIREQANRFMFSEFEKMAKDEASASSDDELDRPTKLHNLIMAMGATFHDVLLSDRSERRVFSVALYDTPPRDVAEVLDLGVRYGYLHVSSIGNKEGTGRTRLYVLSRRLAPFFLLDPTSFAGYLFVKSDDLAKSMLSPTRRLRNLRRDSEREADEPYQLQLFD